MALLLGGQQVCVKLWHPEVYVPGALNQLDVSHMSRSSLAVAVCFNEQRYLLRAPHLKAWLVLWIAPRINFCHEVAVDLQYHQSYS